MARDPSLEIFRPLNKHDEHALDYPTYRLVYKSSEYDGNVAEKHRKVGDEAAEADDMPIFQFI